MDKGLAPEGLDAAAAAVVLVKSARSARSTRSLRGEDDSKGEVIHSVWEHPSPLTQRHGKHQRLLHMQDGIGWVSL